MWAVLSMRNHRTMDQGLKDMLCFTHYLRKNPSVFNNCAIQGAFRGFTKNYGKVNVLSSEKSDYKDPFDEEN
jgi:hypothetical protein